jgi:hypothetical protein
MADEREHRDEPPPAARRRARVPVRRPEQEPTQALPRVAPPRVAPPGRPAVEPPRRTAAATRRMDAAPAPAAPREAPPAPPRRSGRRIASAVALALVALLAVGAAVVVGTHSIRPEHDDGTGGVATGTPNPKHPPQKDVSLDDCRLDASGVAVAGDVRNPTDDAADYVIEVHLVDPDGATITSGSPTATSVPPGEKVRWGGQLPPVRSDAPSGTCTLVRVDRYRSR